MLPLNPSNFDLASRMILPLNCFRAQVTAAIVLAMPPALLLVGCQRSSDLGPLADAARVPEIRKALGADAVEDGGAVAAPVGTGWATLRGVFKFDGEPPSMPPYKVDKDQLVCIVDGHAPPQEWLLVDSNTKGIANVALYLRNPARVHESAQTLEEPHIFDQKDCVFLPHVKGLLVDHPVIVKNSDPPPVGHNTNIEGRNKFNQTIPPGEQVTWMARRDEAAPVSVRCSIHSWMIAYILPRPDLYFAVSGEDGTFEIPNLPAGEPLEFQVWHESATGARGALVVDTASAKEVGWNNRGRFTVILNEDEVREIEIVVPAGAFRSS